MRQVAAGAALTIALAGIVGGVYVAQQPSERVELVQPASGEATAVPFETSAPSPSPSDVPTTTAAPVATTEVSAPAPVESSEAPKPALKETTVAKQSEPKSEPAPSQTQPESTPSVRNSAPPPIPGGLQMPGETFKPGEYRTPLPSPTTEG